MDRFDSRQLGRQRAALRFTLLRLRLGLRAADVGQLGFQGSDIGGHGLVKHLTLGRVHALGLGRKLYAAQARQLVGEFVDLHIALANLAVALCDYCGVLRDALDLFERQSAQGIDISDGIESSSIHAP